MSRVVNLSTSHRCLRGDAFVDVVFTGDILNVGPAIKYPGQPITVLRKPEGSLYQGLVQERLDVDGFYLVHTDASYLVLSAPAETENMRRHIRRDGTSCTQYVLRELLRHYGDAGLVWTDLSVERPFPYHHNPNGPPLALGNYGYPDLHNSAAYGNTY